jgi:hypothetical protein
VAQIVDPQINDARRSRSPAEVFAQIPRVGFLEVLLKAFDLRP